MVHRCTIASLTVCAMGTLFLTSCLGPSKTKKRDCTQAVSRTQQYFHGMCRAQAVGVADRDRGLARVRLATADLPPSRSLPRATLVVLTPGRLRLGKQDVGSWASLWTRKPGTLPKKPFAKDGSEDAEKALYEHTLSGQAGRGVHKLLAKQYVKDGRRPLLLAIAPDTPARQVVTFLSSVVRAGYTRIAFLLAPRRAPKLPPGPEGGKVWKAPSAQRVARVARPWTDKRCPDVKRLLDGLQKAGRLADCRGLAARVAKTVTACGCPVDEGPLLSLIRGFVPPLAFVATHRVTWSRTAKGLQVTDGKQPWRRLLPKVLKLGKDGVRVFGFSLVSEGPQGFGVGRSKGIGPQVTMPRASVTGGLYAAAVRKVMRRSLVKVKGCYMRVGLTKNPKLAGRVKVSWTVKASGAVGRVGLVSSSLKHPPTEKCILKVIQGLRFPPPDGGMPFITYPFILKPHAD